MAWYQTEIALAPKRRGFHLITDEISRNILEVKKIKAGIMHVFIKHSSASLTINENADPTVRTDMESYFNKMIPENMPYFEHDTEGSDDMPAHLKCSYRKQCLNSGNRRQIKSGNLAGNLLM